MSSDLEQSSHSKSVTRLCDCGKVSPMRKAGTPWNKGRGFFGCRNYGKEGHKPCDYFHWVDEEAKCECAKDLLPIILQQLSGMEEEVAKAKGEVSRMEGEVAKAKKSARLYMTAAIGIVIVLIMYIVFVEKKAFPGCSMVISP